MKKCLIFVLSVLLVFNFSIFAAAETSYYYNGNNPRFNSSRLTAENIEKEKFYTRYDLRNSGISEQQLDQTPPFLGNDEIFVSYYLGEQDLDGLIQAEDKQAFFDQFVIDYPQRVDYIIPVYYDGEMTPYYISYQWEKNSQSYVPDTPNPSNCLPGYLEAFQKHRSQEGLKLYMEENGVEGWTPIAYMIYEARMLSLVEQDGEYKFVYYYKEIDRTDRYEDTKVDELQLMTLQEAKEKFTPTEQEREALNSMDIPSRGAVDSEASETVKNSKWDLKAVLFLAGGAVLLAVILVLVLRKKKKA